MTIITELITPEIVANTLLITYPLSYVISAIIFCGRNLWDNLPTTEERKQSLDSRKAHSIQFAGLVLAILAVSITQEPLSSVWTQTRFIFTVALFTLLLTYVLAGDRIKRISSEGSNLLFDTSILLFSYGFVVMFDYAIMAVGAYGLLVAMFLIKISWRIEHWHNVEVAK